MIKKIVSKISSSLQVKLVTIFAVPLLCVVVFSSIYYPMKQKEQELLIANSHVSTLTEILAFSVGVGLKDGNFDLVQTAFNWAIKDPSVNYMSIVDESATTLFEHNPQRLHIDKGALIRTLGTTEMGENLIAVSPVVYENQHHGVIIVGYSLGSVNEAIRSQIWASFWVNLILFAFGITLVVIIARFTTRGVKTMLAAMERLANGDLLVDLRYEAKDELGKLADTFRKTIVRLADAIRKVGEASNAVARSAEEISCSTEEMATGSQEQTTQASEVASAVEEMSKTITENARSADTAAKTAESARSAAAKGGSVVENTVLGMKRIAEVVRHSAHTIEELGKSSDQIGAITSVIDDIADQTNLLALNAAIEAARAGDQGRGFAVVADEVRKLAERTTRATKEIAAMIRKIQADTKEAVHAMDEGTKEVDYGIRSADEAGIALHEIVNVSQNVTDMVTHIAAASEEQSSTSVQISQNVEAINAVTQQTAIGTQTIARAAENLNRLTEKLQQLVSLFKFERGEEDASYQTTAGAKDASLGLAHLDRMSDLVVRKNGRIVPHGTRKALPSTGDIYRTSVR